MDGKNGKVIHTEAELEGSGYSWYIVCGECHGPLRDGVEECPNCYAINSLEGFVLTRKRPVYTGEQTEPAE